MRRKPDSKPPEGYLTVICALMILVVLTLMVFAASRSAVTEALMAGSQARSQRNFYLAEGAALEAADRLLQADLASGGLPGWVEPVAGRLAADTVSRYWDHTAARGDSVVPRPSLAHPGHTLFLAGVEGVAAGNSLGLHHRRVHVLGVWGRCAWQGETTVKLGLRVVY